MLNTDATFIKNDTTGHSDIVLPNPYMHITQDHESIYFQDGCFYKGKDEPEISYDEVPEWFWNIVRKSYSSEYLKKFALVLPEKRKLSQEELTEDRKKRANGIWICDIDECGEKVPMYKKGIHVARHKMAKLKQGEKNAKQIN